MMNGTANVETTEKVAEEVTKEVSQLAQYVHDNIPGLIDFGFRVVLAIVLFVVGRIVIQWIRKIVRHSIERTNADKGVAQFVDSLLKFCLYALLIFIIATKLGVESSSVAALIASAGVAVGLALQGSLSNFAGGILILFLKPFVVGDYIIENGGKTEGTVKEIQIFYTKLSTLDNKTIIIPNGTLVNSTIINVTAKPERQLDLKVGISYQADLRKAKEIVEGLLCEEDGVIKEEGIKVFVDSLADSSVILGIRAWVKTEEYWSVRWRLLENMKLTFDKEGIDIPYNQLTVHMKNDKI